MATSGTWVYLKSEPGLWTVGFYAPDGKWNPESDYNVQEEAAQRTARLNGGASAPIAKKVTDLDMAELLTDLLGNEDIHEGFEILKEWLLELGHEVEKEETE